jgi:hypothetical protein
MLGKVIDAPSMVGKAEDFGCGASLFQPRRALRTKMPRSRVDQYIIFCAKIFRHANLLDLLVADFRFSPFDVHKRDTTAPIT